MRWPDRLDGHRATVRLTEDAVYRGTLRRTRAGWRMGDPVHGPGVAWYDDQMLMYDGEAPRRCPTTSLCAVDIEDVERVPEIDAAPARETEVGG